MIWRLIVLAAFLPPAGALSAQAASRNEQAAETITAADLARHIGVIADDSMRGRSTPSPGLELTARYVASQFEKFGLTPAGDSGTWFQRYPIPKATTATAPNVVGILEGSDPELKNEYIVFSAHMDHLGTGRNLGLETMRRIPVSSDSIYNGASDNASGTAGILELAEAFSRPGARPRRSLVFLAVSGEEMGRWGSKHFVEHPPVALRQLALNFNFDMVGVGRRDSTGVRIHVTGADLSDIGATLDRVVAAHPELQLKPFREERMSSDHRSLAEKGVPILRFGAPTDPNYHLASDSPDKVDTSFEAAVLRLAFYVAREAANADQRPKWNEADYRRITGK
jgi:hypothetical protein